MKIVADTNRIMSALLRDGTSREIIIFGKQHVIKIYTNFDLIGLLKK